MLVACWEQYLKYMFVKMKWRQKKNESIKFI